MLSLERLNSYKLLERINELRKPEYVFSKKIISSFNIAEKHLDWFSLVPVDACWVPVQEADWNPGCSESRYYQEYSNYYGGTESISK